MKILNSLVLIILIILTFGIFWGTLICLGMHLLHNLAITAYYSEGPTLKYLNFLTLFTAYGCYCAPKWGYGYKTDGQKPIDELDEECLQHDKDMFNNRAEYHTGNITRKEFLRRNKNDDFRFLKSALLRPSNAPGTYVLGLIIGFTIRIIYYYLRKPFLK